MYLRLGRETHGRNACDRRGLAVERGRGRSSCHYGKVIWRVPPSQVRDGQTWKSWQGEHGRGRAPRGRWDKVGRSLRANQVPMAATARTLLDLEDGAECKEQRLVARDSGDALHE